MADEWGMEPKKPRREKRKPLETRRSEVVSIRMEPVEVERLELVAQVAHVKPAKLLRDFVNRSASVL